jgi:hypothetical protein
MPSDTENLFRLEDLDDARRTSRLHVDDRDAMFATADWIKDFIVTPNKDLGRPGTVCPFVPGALERKALWLAVEQLGNGGVLRAVGLMKNYKHELLEEPPNGDSDVNYNVICVLFTDLAPDRAQGIFDGVAQQLAVPSYVEDGLLFGPYYKGNESPALYNPKFQPFQSPVPFLFVRHGVVSDWKFFVDDDEWLNLWAQRYGASGAQELAKELRRLPWRSNPAETHGEYATAQH